MNTKHQNGKSDSNLDEYIRVSKPGTKVVLAALLTVLIAMIVWGLIGKLPVTLTVKGLIVRPSLAELYDEELTLDKMTALMLDVEDQEYALLEKVKEYLLEDDVVYCFVDALKFDSLAVSNFNEKVTIEMPDHRRQTGTIESYYPVPLLTPQCQKILFGNEWATERCVQSDYSWFVIISPDSDISDYGLMLSDVTFVTEEVPPISFI